MSNTVTVVGNVVRDPELRHTPNGVAVCEFTLADTPQNFDKQSGKWVDGETDWVKVTVWKKYGENVANSLRKGDKVLVTGRYVTEKYTDTKTGEQRTSRKLIANEVAPTLQWVTATLARTPRSDGGGMSGGGYPSNEGNANNNQNFAASMEEPTPF